MDDLVKKVVESPARAVDDFVAVANSPRYKKPIRIAKKYWGELGPGLTTGASDDDPSGIATYSQAGAIFGFSFLWMSLYLIPFMVVAQEMCGRIAHVTGRGISGVLKQHYSKRIVRSTVLMLFAANTLNIGANIAAMAASTRLVFPGLPFTVLAVFFTLLSLILQISMPYSRYEKFLKYLTLVLFAYIITAFLIRADWAEVIRHTVQPHFIFTKDGIFMMTAIVGTTISPYLFYWQASQVIEQQREEYGRKTLTSLAGTNAKEISLMRKDVTTGMVFSNIVMFFIIAVAGTVLMPKGITIDTAADAAQALRPLAGDFAFLLFAIGIVGTGMLAIPVLAGSASYAFSEAFSLNHGLDKQLKRAYGFYGVIILSMGIGLLINFLGIHPIKALIYSAVINGLVAPVLLTLILLVANNHKIMGEWKNGPVSNILGWFITIIMYIAGIATLWGMFF
ncbi:MAG TPA: divalent metal cation transporter [Patescibacteria group bacterium]